MKKTNENNGQNNNKLIFNYKKGDFDKEFTKAFWNYYLKNKGWFFTASLKKWEKYKGYLKNHFIETHQELVNEAILEMFKNFSYNNWNSLKKHKNNNYTGIVKSGFKLALYKVCVKISENEKDMGKAFIKHKYKLGMLDKNKYGAIYLGKNVDKIIKEEKPVFLTFSELTSKNKDGEDNDISEIIGQEDENYKKIEEKMALSKHLKYLANLLYSKYFLTRKGVILYIILYYYFIDNRYDKLRISDKELHRKKINLILSVLKSTDKRLSNSLEATKEEVEELLNELINTANIPDIGPTDDRVKLKYLN